MDLWTEFYKESERKRRKLNECAKADAEAAVAADADVPLRETRKLQVKKEFD